MGGLTVESRSTLGKQNLSSKNNPITGLNRPRGFQEVQALRFQDNRHTKVLRLSVLRTGRTYPPGNIPGNHLRYKLSQLQGHSPAERIISMKNSNVTIGNRTRYLPTCSVVPQPTAPPRTSYLLSYIEKPTKPPYQLIFLLGIMRLKRDVNYSTSHNSVFRNEWSLQV